jgi:hypothetical protein
MKTEEEEEEEEEERHVRLEKRLEPNVDFDDALSPSKCWILLKS